MTHAYKELLAIREIGANGMYVCLKPKIPVVLTPGLVKEMRHLQNSLAERYLSSTFNEFFYVVWFLEKQEGLSCHGLDFNYILNCVKNHKDTELELYIDALYNMIFLNYIGLGLPIINCSIVTRPLSGLTKELFLLNKICFIQNPESSGINKIALDNRTNQLEFDKSIYATNDCYTFDIMRMDEMSRIIGATHHEIPTTAEVKMLQEQFEKIKKESLLRIYSLASRDIKILERMARYELRLCA